MDPGQFHGGRRLQFSIRTLLVLTTLVAAFMAVVSEPIVALTTFCMAVPAVLGFIGAVYMIADLVRFLRGSR